MPDVPVEAFGVAPAEAFAIFRAKGFAFGFAWEDVWQAEHARAFTVAKAMSLDVLTAIREAVDRSLADGETLDEFKKALTPKLQELGWWGRKRMIDPVTMEAGTVQLGSPRRLKTIFQVNMRTAAAQGRWERIERNKALLPYLQYSAIMDGRERPEHGAWNGTVKPVDDPWWNTHYPPCGWNCRCTVKPLSAKMMERRGLTVTEEPASFPDREWRNKRTGEVSRIEEGIDPGWDYHVGKLPDAGLPSARAVDAATRESAPETIAKFGRSVIGGHDDKRELPLERAGGRHPAEVRGYTRTLPAETVAKVLRKHGGDAEPTGPNDFGLIPQIIEQGSAVVEVRRDGSQSVVWKAEINGRTVTLVERIGHKRQLLRVKSLWIGKGARR